MKKLKKITIHPILDKSISFLCTKEFEDEKQSFEQIEVLKEDIVDYFVSLKNYKKVEEDFLIELKTLSYKDTQQSIWEIYEIFSKEFLQKIYEEPHFANSIELSSPWPLYIKGHNFQKIKEKSLIFIDCETNGLYGEFLSFALLFYDAHISNVNTYYIYRTDIENLKDIHTFVKESVIPRMDLSKLQDYEEIKCRFTQDFSEKDKINLFTKTASSERILFEESAKILNRILQEESDKNKTFILAESPYPVEFLFFKSLFELENIELKNKKVFADKLIDWYSVKINADDKIVNERYKNSIHNALVDVLINYDDYIELKGRYYGKQ